MKRDIEIEKYGIIVVQSLNSNDRKTGEELHHDVLQYKQYIREDMFACIKYATTKVEFFSLMKEIEEYASENNHAFTLHFETHGDNNGVYLASGECVTWKEFNNCLRSINEALYNNLLVVMAMCKGGAIVCDLDIDKRAPYRAFIGAFRNVTSNEIAEGFNVFYSDFINILDSFACLENMNKALNPEENTFWMMTGEDVFNAVLDPDRDRIAFENVVKKVTKKIRKKERKSLREMIRITKKKMLADKKNKIDYYCFKDIYKKDDHV